MLQGTTCVLFGRRDVDIEKLGSLSGENNVIRRGDIVRVARFTEPSRAISPSLITLFEPDRDPSFYFS